MSDKGKVYRFGDFRLEMVERSLFEGDERIPLPVKAVELLELLIENRGRTVEKDEILSTIWQDTFVDENNLPVLVSNLRKAFRETKHEKRFIETVPRRGYRFVHEVVVDEAERQTESPRTLPSVVSPLSRSSKRVRVVAISAVILGLIAFAFSAKIWRDDARNVSVLRPEFGTPSTVSRTKAVLIMPFRIQEKRDDGFEFDFTRALNVRLGSLNKFHVRPQFTIADDELRRSLGTYASVERADFVIEGTVEMLEEGKFRVESSLLDVTSKSKIWSEKLEDSNLTSVQDRIAAKSAEAIIATLPASERERLARRRPTNLAAYSMYLDGLERFRSRQPSASFFFQDSVRLDPEFAQGWAMLACSRAFGGWKGSPAAIEAKNYLEKALSADDQLSDAFAVQGFIKIFHEFDWAGGEQSLKRALELDPLNINARLWYGWYLAVHRRVDEAKAELEKALELDPLSATVLSDLGRFYYYSNDLERAMELNRRALTIVPDHSFAAGFVASMPRKDFDRERVLQDLELKVAGDRTSFNLAEINVDPYFDPLRDDPRFIAVLKHANLR